MTSIEGLVQQVQELTDLTQAQVRTIEEKDAEIAAERHASKNFHSMLCERFGYTHDEVDWKRDQVSLLEFIAQEQAPEAAMPTDEDIATSIGLEVLPDDFLISDRNREVDFLRYDGALVRAYLAHSQQQGAEPAAPQQHAQAAQHQCPKDTPYGQATCGKCLEDSQAAQSEKEQFLAHLRACTAIVETWPEWKRTITAPAQPIAGELPPLPEHWAIFCYSVDRKAWFQPPDSLGTKAYTSDQMRTYGHQCRAAALEEAAKMCEAQQKLSDENMAVLRGAAAAIRALNKTEGA